MKMFFFSEWNFKDKEEEESYYDLSEQKRLNTFLERTVNSLEQERDNQNSEKIDEIIRDLEDLKSKVHITKKGVFAKGLSKIFGKIYVTGTKILEKIVVDAGAEMLGKFAGGFMKGLMEG